LGVRPLPGENLIVIALVWSPPLAFDGISLLCSGCGEFTERTLVLTERSRPVEAVFFSWSADKTPRVDALTCKTLFGIFLLGGDVDATGVDRAHFVAADAAVNDFRACELRIESPSVVQAHQPDGERPAFFTDNQHGLVLAVGKNLIFGAEGCEETAARGRIVHRVAGPQDLVTAWPQHPHHFLQCIASHCVDERRDRVLGTAVALLREGPGRNSKERRRQYNGCKRQEARKPKGSENRRAQDHDIARIYWPEEMIPTIHGRANV